VTGEPGFAKTYLAAEQIARNAIPTAPVLVFPENFKTDLVKPFTFTWNKASDLDGDPLTYRHCVWEVKQRYSFKDCDAASVQTTSWDRGFLYAALVALLGCLLFAVLILMGMKNRRGLLILVALAILAAVILAFYIGWTRTVSRTVSELESGKAYFWKVIAEDGKGGSTESETRRFAIK
jgi:VIT1/CCC1 family predicted Fe2+/Mn2+ transporter